MGNSKIAFLISKRENLCWFRAGSGETERTGRKEKSDFSMSIKGQFSTTSSQRTVMVKDPRGGEECGYGQGKWRESLSWNFNKRKKVFPRVRRWTTLGTLPGKYSEKIWIENRLQEANL